MEVPHECEVLMQIPDANCEFHLWTVCSNMVVSEKLVSVVYVLSTIVY